MAEKKKSQYIIQNVKVFLTYKTHLNKLEYRRHIEELLRDKEVKILEMAHETGDSEHDYEHTHVAIRTAKIMKSTNARFFDYEEIHPHIKKPETETHWKNMLAYLSKEDPECGHLKGGERPLADKVAEKECLRDAMRMCTKYSDALGIEKMFNIMKIQEVAPPRLDWEWQLELVDYVMGPVHKRHIIWIWDPVGNTGKTDVCKYLGITRPNETLIVNAMGGARDFATIVKGAVDRGWNWNTVIVDLPRDAETKSIYEPLEAVKNGFVTATKYQGMTVMGNAPHVIVLANFPPEQHRMSKDRWVIRKIEGKEARLNIIDSPLLPEGTLNVCDAELLDM